MRGSSHEQQYYIDFARSGGVVSSGVLTDPFEDASRSPLILSSTHRVSNETRVAAYSERIKGITSQAARLPISANRTLVFARKRLRELVPAQERFISLGSGYYYSQFTVEQPNSIGTNGQQIEGATDSPTLSWEPGKASINQIFQLDQSAYHEWSKRIGAEQTTFDEYVSLKKVSANETSHPLYNEMLKARLIDRIKESYAFLDTFWGDFKVMLDNGESTSQEDYLRANLLHIALIQRIAPNDKAKVLSEVVRIMDNIGITALSVGNGAVIGYRIGDTMRYRSLPIPEDKVGLFQRYRALKEKPLTEDQALNMYNTMVSPEKRLSKRSRDTKRSQQGEEAAFEKGDFVSALYMLAQRKRLKVPELIIRRVMNRSDVGYEAVCKVKTKDGREVQITGTGYNSKDSKQNLAEKLYELIK